ncbi:hypothetical protein MUN86_28350 (plasmid) [Hymenobacter volaticus]|uniref:Uncharacterized protein n=2 Tax=Hymenobacter volaticus TaxID=2932254 RepID=A0ABY4GF90_9BACT|nr:hypothetical protein MUN86_28350 [Hymenobacter volaticus]
MDRVAGMRVTSRQVYVTGFFNHTADFGDTHLRSAGQDDVFVTKLADHDSTSRFVWTLQAGSPGADQATAIGVQGTNIYVAGDFEQTARFGSLNLTSGEGADIFISKVEDRGPNARFVWAQRAGGAQGTDRVSALAVQGNRVYIAGHMGAAARTLDRRY